MASVKQAIVKLYDSYGIAVSEDRPQFDNLWWNFYKMDVRHLHDYVRLQVPEVLLHDDDCGDYPCDTELRDMFIGGLFSSATKAISYDLVVIDLSPRRVFRSGYCYLNIFVGLHEHVPENGLDDYLQFLYQVPTALGSWPTGQAISRACEFLLNKIPELRDAPVPVVSVHHGRNLAHVADIRGTPQSWHPQTIRNMQQLQMWTANTSLKTAQFGGVVRDARDHLYACVRAANKTRNPEVTFNKMVLNDTQLAAALLLNPATLYRLGSWLDLDKNAQKLLLALEGTECDSLIRLKILETALKGVQVHLTATDLDEAIGLFQQQMIEHLQGHDQDEQFKLAAINLYNQLLTGEEKTYIVSSEKQTLLSSESRFQRECGIGGLRVVQSFCTERLRSCRGICKEFLFPPSLASNTRQVVLFLWWLMFSAFSTGYCLAYWVIGFFTLKTMVINFIRLWLTHNMGRHYSHHMWFMVVTFFSMLVTVYVSLRSFHKKISYCDCDDSCAQHSKDFQGTKLQMSDSERKATSLMAFSILCIHIFDVDLAGKMATSFHNVTRLLSHITDETRGIIPHLLGTRLQGLDDGEDDNERVSVPDIQEIILELDPEEVQQHKLTVTHDTFDLWVAGKTLSDQSYTRPLQYGSLKIDFIITPNNQEDVASDMVNTKKCWNSVFGSTGSGKSTRIPVLYQRLLAAQPTRQKRVLVCEPSRATVVNVAAGISQFYGQQVTWQHGTKNQLGDLNIQVMTYGSAFMKAVHNPTFLKTFDAVFLDESHSVNSHNLALESLLNKSQYDHIRKFYMSATPRVGQVDYSAQRRFAVQEIAVENSDVDYWFKRQGSGDRYDILDKGDVILCFVAGRNEADKFAQKVTVSGGVFQDFKGFSLHAQNFDKNYPKIIRASNNEEKIVIFCTNILETGVTLNADCVVDFGFTMRPVLDLLNRSIVLQRYRATRFERHQRIGRVGRVKDGVALVCGKTTTDRPLVTPEVVYEAALYSFLYDLDLYSDDLDTSWLSGVSREQALVMTRFDLPVFLLKDLVSHDGCVRPESTSWLKNHMIADMQLKTRDFTVPTHVFRSWPTAHSMVMRHYTSDEITEPVKQMMSCKVPFSAFHINASELEEYIKVSRAMEPRAHIFKGDTGMKRVVLMHVDKDNVNQCYSVAMALLKQLEQMKMSLVSISERVKSSQLISCLGFSKSLTLQQEGRIQVITKNISEVQKHIEALRRYDTLVTDNDEVMSSLLESEDFSTVFQHVTLQSDGLNSKQELAKLLNVSNTEGIGVKDLIFAHGSKLALGFLVVGSAYMLGEIYKYVTSRPMRQFVLEGKGKRYDRSKRSEAAAVNEAFDMFERLKSSKGQKRRDKQDEERLPAVSRLLKKTNPFVNFYDLGGDENVEKAVFKTLDDVVVHETQTPVQDVKKLDRMLAFPQEMGNGSAWADDEEKLPDKLKCEVTLKDGRTLLTYLAPHNPRMVTRTGGLMGYTEHDTEYRQVGSSKLEMSSAIPQSKVTPMIASMVGVVTAEGKPRMCALLYGDYIIMPAHIQMMELPLTFRFDHAYFTIEKPVVMRFSHCDLILIRKPNVVAPIKVHAKAAVMKEPTLVQLMYRETGTFRSIVSASDTTAPFPNGRWTYSISTKAGMCGAAVVDVKNGTFVGIHVAANEPLRKNFMEPLSSDMVDVLANRAKFIGDDHWVFVSEECGYIPGELSQLQGDDRYQWDLMFDPMRYTVDGFNSNASGWDAGIPHCEVFPAAEPIAAVISGGGFEVLAHSKSNLCNKHKIVGESPYWKQFKQQNRQLVEGIDVLENHYAPSALNRCAYYKDVSKYDRPVIAKPDVDRLTKARLMVTQDLINAGMGKSFVRTPQQVLADLEVNTAAGALYACKKKVIFAGWSDGKLLKFADDCFTNLKRGGSMGVWNGSLKDELRPIEKVLENKTRVFTAAPITTLIGGKFVVDDFNQQFYATNCKARHTVGINPWAGGWERLAKFLGGQNMPYYISGDGSRFDSSLDPIMFDQVLKLRKDFLSADEGAHEALRNLYQEIVYTPILLENGQVVMKKVGNPSGQPSTVVDNTLILMMCFYYCALCVFDDPEEIRSNFLFVCNGDDQKCALTKHFVDSGGLNFEEKLKECGLTYEFDEVTDDITEYPYMSLTMVPRLVNGVERIGFILSPERIVAINQWMGKKGVLGVAQRAFPAMLHAFNDPWLFNIMHAYMVWLLISFEDEILYQSKQTGECVSYLSPELVQLLHYGGTQLQVDSDNDGKDKQVAEAQTSKGMPTIVTPWALPKLTATSKSMGFRKIGGRYRNEPALIKAAPMAICDLLRNDVATDQQFMQWEEAVKNDYSIKDNKQWDTVLMIWALYCANNGTSDKLDPKSVLPIPGAGGETLEVEISGFLRPSRKVGLRKIMRKLSRETSAMLEQQGVFTKWGVTHGLIENRMIPYAFDFYVFDEMTPQWARQQLTAIKHSSIGAGVHNSVDLDGKHHSQVVTNKPNSEQNQQKFQAVYE